MVMAVTCFSVEGNSKKHIIFSWRTIILSPVCLQYLGLSLQDKLFIIYLFLGRLLNIGIMKEKILLIQGQFFEDGGPLSR